MIAKLKGTIESVEKDSVLINCGFIGYQVFVSGLTKENCIESTEITLYIEHVFKNEQQYLVGFINLDEKQMFKLLLDVQGVGVKMALNILAIMQAHNIKQAIIEKNTKLLCNAEGVGEKVAKRIILELSNKIIKTHFTESPINQSDEDLLTILLNLGYNKAQAIKHLEKAQNQLKDSMSIEEKTKIILKNIGS